MRWRVWIPLFGFAFLVGCGNKILRGDWTATDARYIPEKIARLQFSDEHTVLLGDGTTSSYKMIDEKTVDIRFAEGDVRRFEYKRDGENLTLKDRTGIHSYMLQQ